MKLKATSILVIMAALLLAVGACVAETDNTEVSAYAFINERYEALGDFDYWPLEEKAAFSAWCAEEGIDAGPVYGLPGEDNMTAEEAVEMAKAAIVEKYGVLPELYEKYNVQIDFLIGVFVKGVYDKDPSPEDPLWGIVFRLKDPDEQFLYDMHYTAIIDDQLKEVIGLFNQAETPG